MLAILATRTAESSSFLFLIQGLRRGRKTFWSSAIETALWKHLHVFYMFYMFLYVFDVYDNQTLRTYSFSPIRLWTTPFWFWLEMFAKYLLHKKDVLIWTKLEVLEKWCEIVCQLSRGADIHYFLLLCSHSLPPLAPSNSSFLWGPSLSWPWSSWWGKPLYEDLRHHDHDHRDEENHSRRWCFYSWETRGARCTLCTSGEPANSVIIHQNHHLDHAGNSLLQHITRILIN